MGRACGWASKRQATRAERSRASRIRQQASPCTLRLPAARAPAGPTCHSTPTRRKRYHPPTRRATTACASASSTRERRERCTGTKKGYSQCLTHSALSGYKIYLNGAGESRKLPGQVSHTELSSVSIRFTAVIFVLIKTPNTSELFKLIAHKILSHQKHFSR